ncbi:hypothetical protein F7725_000493 [Dissostichus mawsoni]|uniref:Uncharacterized protein n=1 Tax=Dissostichus mawsoni TaxID=36200 RepID=A0A7J5ZIT3_DISMA|nr:hypothetical protein F7725_000493 [Dissostichus mawsoni]
MSAFSCLESGCCRTNSGPSRDFSCSMLVLMREKQDRAVRLRSALESQLNSGVSSADVWDKTVSFFTVKKALIFQNGYSKSSREALRLFPSPAEDVAPLCCQ